MIRALWTAATGMNAQQFNIDTISHNIANVNTAGYKKSRADFEDLLYQTLKMAGTPATEETVVPTYRHSSRSRCQSIGNSKNIRSRVPSKHRKYTRHGFRRKRIF